jgi:proline iminopeptidase
MVPAHLKSALSSDQQRRLGQTLPPPPPSLCVTGAMCRGGRLQLKDGMVIAYNVFRPRLLKDANTPPVVVLHGGPSIPSNYLLPLVNGITDRAIVFYDQVGCGRSTRPPAGMKFQLDLAVDHLIQLLHQHLQLPLFHLYGHSFGGILAFEYWKRVASTTNPTTSSTNCCLSITLASAPTSTQIIHQETQRLYKELRQESDEPTTEEEEDSKHKQEWSNKFSKQYECRLEHLPLALQDAYAQAGPVSWRGLGAIEGYHAKVLDEQQQEGAPLETPPTLLLLGEFDFCTELCMQEWKTLLTPEPTTQVVHNCSHYGMCEDERQYGSLLTAFFQQHDPKG